MEKITLDQFRTRVKAQNVSDRIHAAFKCPMCKTVQSMKSFICAGADAETAEKYIGFSCIGRTTGADGPRKKPDGKPCNWTLGGLFRLHELEVVDDEERVHPYFEVATAEEAQALEAALATPEGKPDGCEWCIEGLQADGVTPCSCQEVAK
jgi:hypothetical protein